MYIRTKDAVYENANPYFIEDNKLYMGWDYPADFEPDFLGDILNQSENLEELCDQIVYNGYLYQNKITWDGSLVEDSFEELEEPITDEMIKEGIYGAIWTSKGLIYVAKMDNDGKLVLI